MWKRHWKLTRDPFLDGDAPYVPLASREEAVARLVHTIESGQRLAIVRAPAGLGKSRVLARALAEMRSPSRRVAPLSSPIDGAGLLAGLAERLGIRVPAGSGRSTAWRALGDAVRLCRWQRLQVVLAIDDCQDLVDPTDRLDLERLVHLDPHPEARLTVVQVFRTPEDDEPASATPWELVIRLPALTRSEAERYLAAKLAAAGRDEPTFTPPRPEPPPPAHGGHTPRTRPPRLARADGRRQPRARDHHPRRRRRGRPGMHAESLGPVGMIVTVNFLGSQR